MRGELQELVERLALLVVERAEHVVLDEGQRELGLAEQLAPGGRELDEVAAPVLG